MAVETRETVLGEFPSRKRAVAAREALAGLLKGRYDLSGDFYAVPVDGGEGYLRLKDVGRSEVHVVLETHNT